MRTLRQLVIGTDFGECAEQALDIAIELAAGAAETARITIVHVCQWGTDERDEQDEQRLQACERALAELIARKQQTNVELSAVLRRGTPWEKLDNVAVETGATLIVVGRHGAGRGCGVEIGTVAAHLVRGASRPVLTVPPEFKDLPFEANENNKQRRK